MDINRFKFIEDRFLPRLTSIQVNEIPKEDALLILPVGATEQHGPHLPVFTDSILVESVLNAAFSNMTDVENVWMLPTVPFGKSNEHNDRPGTFTLSADTLKSLYIDLCRSAKANGFKKLLLFNGHGGNNDTLKLIARDMKIETGMMIFIVNVGALTVPEDIVSKEELVMGIHGGDYETSLLMSSYPEWVEHDKLPNEVPKLAEMSSHLRFQNGNFAWTIDDVSLSGVLGNATLATKEKGTALYKAQGNELALIIEDILHFEISELIQD